MCPVQMGLSPDFFVLGIKGGLRPHTARAAFSIPILTLGTSMVSPLDWLMHLNRGLKRLFLCSDEMQNRLPTACKVAVWPDSAVANFSAVADLTALGTCQFVFD